MLFTNPTQIIVLALVLVVGFLFGLASHPGGKKWKRLYQEEKATHARNRDLAETKARADSKRITALERANADLAREHDTLVVRGAGYVAPVALAPLPGSKRWFEWGSART